MHRRGSSDARRWARGGSIFPLFLVIALLAGAAFVEPARAGLARVGPADVPSPPGHGFPLWYQDFNGLTLDVCYPTPQGSQALNQAQIDACLLTPAPGEPYPTLPFVFPSAFPEELFWYAASAGVPFPDGSLQLVEMALEAAFGIGPPAAGEQISFGRVRFFIDAPEDGTYTVTYPYGTEVFPGVTAGRRAIKFTSDIGIGAPGDFTGALRSALGPFLTPTVDELGSPVPPRRIGTGLFLTDGAELVRVAGSPFGTNYAEICGVRADGTPIDLGGPAPGLCAGTDLFTVIGKIHEGGIPSPLAAGKASYRRPADGSAQLDVFASASPGIGQADPQLSFFGTGMDVPLSMAGPDSLGRYYGQAVFSAGAEPAVVPASITVTNYGDNPPTAATRNVTDEVSILQASLGADNVITVTATSSDKAVPPALVLTGIPNVAPVPMGPAGDGSDPALKTASVTFTGAVPPDTVTVESAAGGVDTEPLALAAGAGSPPAHVPPVAVDDAYVALEDTPLVVPLRGVLDNDSNADGETVRAVLSVGPVNGTLVLSADGSFTYTPNPNFAGTDSFRYVAQETVPTPLNSNVATVTITVGPGNDAPVAPAVTAATSAGLPITIVLPATDPDGDALTVTAEPISAGGGVVEVLSATVPPYTVRYTPPAVAAGPDVFTYSASDGALSATGTVTVNVILSQAVGITAAQYKGGSNPEWRVDGTSTPVPGTTITVDLYSSAGVRKGTVGTATPDALGVWRIRLKGAGLVAAVNGDRVQATSSIPPNATSTRFAVTVR